MAYFLAKTDPKTYSIDDLERDRTTVWDGVRSAAALLAIRVMHTNDEVLIYHSQSEAAIVGLARVVSEPRLDPNESHSFDDWALVRQGRLSTMSVPENVVAWLKEKKAL